MNSRRATPESGHRVAPASSPAPSGSTVLFLDVDGVLNRVGTRERSPRGAPGVEPAKCEMVRRIVRETDAQIVVSSTWRKDDELMDYLWRELGQELRDRWAGNTPVLETQQESGLYVAKVRGDEIQAWLDGHPEVTRFVILDDEADMAHLTPHLLRTHGRGGLTDEITEAAIRRLKRANFSASGILAPSEIEELRKDARDRIEKETY